MAGCQTTVIGPTPPSQMHTSIKDHSNLQEESIGGSISSDEAVMTDPSAARLHDIAGAILLYRAVKGEMPRELTDLKTVTDEPLDFTSPITQTPYVYAPAGMRYPGRSKAVVLYEPSARARGTRWCVLMSDTKPGAAQALEVIELPESDFLAYQ